MKTHFTKKPKMTKKKEKKNRKRKVSNRREWTPDLRRGRSTSAKLIIFNNLAHEILPVEKKHLYTCILYISLLLLHDCDMKLPHFTRPL